MSTPALRAQSRQQGTRPTRTRHVVLSLTVAAYMITYMDRVVMSAAVPSIRDEFGFDLVTMGWILASFRWGYALFQIPGGWLGDSIGPRRALSLTVSLMVRTSRRRCKRKPFSSQYSINASRFEGNVNR